MGDFIFDMCEKVFGSGLITSVGNMIDSVFSALGNLLVTYNGVINIMFGVAASLMVIYFFQSLIDQASRDMFSLEKLIVAFIKMLVAFSVMVYLPDILQLILKLGGAFTAVIEEAATATDSASVAALKEDYHNYFHSITHIIPGIGYILTLIIPWIICFVCELMAKFIIISNGVMFGARMIFSPVAISQLFEDGSKSSGMKYLKGLFADAISFSVILLIMLVANNFALSAFEGGAEIANMVGPEKLREILDWEGITNIVITRLVIAGGMASASKIAHDVLGA